MGVGAPLALTVVPLNNLLTLRFTPAPVIAAPTPTPIPLSTLPSSTSLSATQVINLSNNGVNDRSPLVLDDGRIVFVSDRDGGAPGDGDHLYVMDAFGSNVQRITEASVSRATRDTMPALAADGQIVFSSQLLDNPQLYTIDVDGGGRVRLSRDNARADVSPAWQPQFCSEAVLSEAR